MSEGFEWRVTGMIAVVAMIVGFFGGWIFSELSEQTRLLELILTQLEAR